MKETVGSPFGITPMKGDHGRPFALSATWLAREWHAFGDTGELAIVLLEPDELPRQRRCGCTDSAEAASHEDL